jgi:hypothetical protein
VVDPRPPERVRHLPGPVSPRYRGRVPKLSATYRSHGVHYEPGSDTSVRFAVEKSRDHSVTKRHIHLAKHPI